MGYIFIQDISPMGHPASRPEMWGYLVAAVANWVFTAIFWTAPDSCTLWLLGSVFWNGQRARSCLKSLSVYIMSKQLCGVSINTLSGSTSASNWSTESGSLSSLKWDLNSPAFFSCIGLQIRSFHSEVVDKDMWPPLWIKHLKMF